MAGVHNMFYFKIFRKFNFFFLRKWFLTCKDNFCWILYKNLWIKNEHLKGNISFSYIGWKTTKFNSFLCVPLNIILFYISVENILICILIKNSVNFTRNFTLLYTEIRQWEWCEYNEMTNISVSYEPSNN